MRTTTNTTIPADVIAALEALDPEDLDRVGGMVLAMIEVAEKRRQRPPRKRTTVAPVNPRMTFR